jgi:putative flavoprotein involved in K+ transport
MPQRALATGRTTVVALAKSMHREQGGGVRTSCVVVGAGPAGIAVSEELVRRGIDHVVLERDEVASTWRNQRWDGFRLNTSDWMNGMLGPMPPGAFPGRDEVVARLDSLADGLPVRAGTPVEHLRRESDGFSILTADAELRADSVVIASGLLNVPRTPAVARVLPDDVLSISGADFRCADALPAGAVLVVGGGQSGVQIAENLASAGRRVFLSTCQVGRFNWSYRGRETFRWLDDLGYWTQRPLDLPDPAMLRWAQPLVGGGGRTLNLPMLAVLGVVLLGRLTDVVGRRAVFDGSGAANVASGEQRWSATCALIDAYIAAHGSGAAAAWEEEGGDDVRIGQISSLHLGHDDISSVIWCTGFTGDLTYLDPPVQDASGQVRRHGSASEISGLWFAGFPWLVNRRSGIFYGLPVDAAQTIDQLTEYLARG